MIKLMSISTMSSYWFFFTVLLFCVAFPDAGLHGQELKAMSFNIRYDNPRDGINSWAQRKASVVQLIRNHTPDVLGIQEGLLHQVDYMTGELKGYAWVGEGRDTSGRSNEFCALFYREDRFELLDSGTFWLSESGQRGSVGWDAALPRICTYVLLLDRPSQKAILVMNTHYDHIGHEAREGAAQVMLDTLAQMDTTHTISTLLLGDFNALPGSAAIRSILSVMDDPLQLPGIDLDGPYGTFNGFDVERELDNRIDYIFTKGVHVRTYAHIPDRRDDGGFVSDHLPVVVTCELSGN